MSLGATGGGSVGYRTRRKAAVLAPPGTDATSAGVAEDPTDPTKDGTSNGKSTGDGGKHTKDPYKDPKTVDRILNPTMVGLKPDEQPRVHVAPSPLKGPNVFNPNAGGSLAPSITGVPTTGAKTGTGPAGVPVYTAPPDNTVSPKTAVNPALTGVSAKEAKKSPTEYGRGPSGETVHKAPSATQGSNPGKQSLSSTAFASANMPVSASAKNVVNVKAPPKDDKKKDDDKKDNKKKGK